MLGQVVRFGLVGAVATAVHMMIGSVLILGQVAPLIANLVAFLVAFFISFAGHYGYSFSDTALPIAQSIRRFAVVAVCGFILNQSILLVLLSRARMDPITALVLSTGFAATTGFVASRFWAFRRATLTAQTGNDTSR